MYISRTTKSYERNYEATERELACVVWCFKRGRDMLEGSKVVIISDHLSIKEVLNSSASTVYSLRIDKARMDMAPNLEDVEVWYRPGKDYVRGRVKYKVEFEGLGAAHSEWWDRADVSEELIEEFERRGRDRQPIAVFAAEPDEN